MAQTQAPAPAPQYFYSPSTNALETQATANDSVVIPYVGADGTLLQSNANLGTTTF